MHGGAGYRTQKQHRPKSDIYLGVDSLHVGLEIPFLRKGSRTEGTGVGFFPCMLDHVRLQGPLLVKSLPTFTTFKRPFTWRGRNTIKI